MQKTLIIEVRSEAGKIYLLDKIGRGELPFLRFTGCIKIRYGFAIYLRRLRFENNGDVLMDLKKELSLLPGGYEFIF